MSSLALRALRSTAPAQRIVTQGVTKRLAHGQAHNPMPFDFSNKRTFAIKASLYMGTAFAIPFIATWWTWNKPGGIHNP